MSKINYILLLATVILLAGCNGNEPEKQSGNPSFTYSISKVPFTVQFTNTSEGVRYYTWDFGDGETSTEENPQHVYKAYGNYKVTLTGPGEDRILRDYERTVSIKHPKIYWVGYELVQVPYSNKHYTIFISNDDDEGEYWGTYTVPSPLINYSDLIYTKNFINRELFTHVDKDTYYYVYVYYSATADGETTQCMKQQLSTNAMYECPGKHFLKSNNTQTQIYLLFDYEL